MRANLIIHDKGSGRFWTGTEWNRHHAQARMYLHAAEAVAVAREAKDSAKGPVEVIDGYEYANPRIVWSS